MGEYQTKECQHENIFLCDQFKKLFNWMLSDSTFSTVLVIIVLLFKKQTFINFINLNCTVDI